MAPARSKRRKSTSKVAGTPSSAGSTGVDEEEALKAFWVDQKQNYRAPSPQPLETIFESVQDENQAVMDESTPLEGADQGSRPPRRTRGQRHLLEVGKYLQRRAIEPPKYWLEDKEKTRHRKKMAQMAAKGQKKLRLVALSEEQENALRAVIENQPVDSDSEDEASKQGPWVTQTPRKTPTPMSPPLPRTPLATPSSFFSPQVSSGSRKNGSNRRRSSLLKPGLPVLREHSQSHGSPSLWPPVISHHITTPKSTDSGFVIPNEEIRRQIEEADSLFGMIPGTETPQSEVVKSRNGSDRSKILASSPSSMETASMMVPSGTSKGASHRGRRATISVKVRRSSRLFKGNDQRLEAVGSIYQVAEIAEKPRRFIRTSPVANPISLSNVDMTPESPI